MSATFQIGDTRHMIGARTLVMGVLNVTPDSFSDGGKFDDGDLAHEHAVKMIAEGADIIDIGGESTRPGAADVDEPEELRRVIPAVERLAAATDTPISVDTYKAKVARRAVAAGATVINDVWGLQRDRAMAGVVAETGATLIAMHNREAADETIDIMDDITRFFDKTLRIAGDAGIGGDRIVLDPGIGFGKTPGQNATVLKKLGDLKRFGLPLLIGTSRKSMFGKLLGLPVERRLNATIASNVLAVAVGADIVRVHDVREHVEACRFADLIVRNRDG